MHVISSTQHGTKIDLSVVTGNVIPFDNFAIKQFLPALTSYWLVFEINWRQLAAFTRCHLQWQLVQGNNLKQYLNA